MRGHWEDDTMDWGRLRAEFPRNSVRYLECFGRDGCRWRMADGMKLYIVMIMEADELFVLQ